MGHEVRRLALAAAALAVSPASGETPAAGLDVFYASDSDHTEVLNRLLNGELSPEALVRS